MITTTLAKLKDSGACVERYTFLRKELGKDYKMETVLPLTKILETNGLDDVLWVLGNAVEGGDNTLRLWAADCAEHVLHFFTDKYPDDKRPAEAIKAARQFVRGEITKEQLIASAAYAYAYAAAASASAAYASAAAAYAAYARDVEIKWQTDRLIQYLKEEV